MIQKEPYFTTQMDASFYTLKGYFWNFIPLWVPYGKIVSRALQNGLQVDQEYGVLEKAVPFGSGWIGVKVNNPAGVAQSGLRHLRGEYHTYEHVGSYRHLWQAYKSIMADYPKADDFYNLYLNDPKTTPEKDLKTRILFKA